MNCKDRLGNKISGNETQNNTLNYLYNKKTGRALLSILVRPFISNLVGFFLNRRISKLMIPSFIKNNNINTEEYEDRKYHSYNDYFMRNIKPERRPFSIDPNDFCSPCDCKLSVYDIKEDSSFNVKNTEYTLESLLKDSELAYEYVNGKLLIFRLSVDDYHHYAFNDDGTQLFNKRIPGFYHTVNPLANDVYPIYKENSREYTLFESKNFGKMIIMEVGAMCVGRIANTNKNEVVKRGDERGHFEFGGSTIIICLKQDIIELDNDITDNSLNNTETKIKMGEKIGTKKAR